jgi:hypothetical protein
MTTFTSVTTGLPPATFLRLRVLADRAEAAKEECVCTQYADALCDESIFEVKSIEDMMR